MRPLGRLLVVGFSLCFRLGRFLRDHSRPRRRGGKVGISRLRRDFQGRVGAVVGLAVVARDDEGNHPEVVEVFEDCVHRLDALRKRYRTLGMLVGWFWSSEAV